jgi:hypothetical protein
MARTLGGEGGGGGGGGGGEWFLSSFFNCSSHSIVSLGVKSRRTGTLVEAKIVYKIRVLTGTKYSQCHACSCSDQLEFIPEH